MLTINKLLDHIVLVVITPQEEKKRGQEVKSQAITHP